MRKLITHTLVTAGLVLSLASAASAPSAFAQSGQSFTEAQTVSYLQEKFSLARKCAAQVLTLSYTKPFLTFDYKTDSECRSGENLHQIDRLDMRFVQTARFNNVWSLYVTCTDTCGTVFVPQNGHEYHRQEAYIEYPVGSPVEAERIVRALLHLASMNRVSGQRDPFD